MTNIHLGVVFGSRTAEHDISIVTGLQLLENVDTSKYDAYPIYISKTGEWFVGDALRDMKTYENFQPNSKSLTRVYLPPVPGCNGLYEPSSGGLFQKSKKVVELDCAILAMHGMHGEDGTLQGLFELADIPYSSSGVTGSAVGMDKIIMKAVFESMGLPVLPSKYYYRSDWKANSKGILTDAKTLGFPLFVKPANLGSSIGIGRANDETSLENAFEVAFSYDRRVLVEKGLEHPREVNCAAFGFGAECTPSLCEQPVNWSEFLSFDDKYMRNASSKGMQSLARQIPAPISDQMTKAIQDMTCAVFKMFECKGVVRIDYLIDGETVYINEINTIPGSFAFYLFEPMGIRFKDLIDRLVDYAYRAYREKQESVYAFDSDVLKKAALGGGVKGMLKGSKVR